MHSNAGAFHKLLSKYMCIILLSVTFRVCAEEVLHKIERMEGRPGHGQSHTGHSNRDVHSGANDSLRPSQSVRVAGPGVNGPGVVAPRYPVAAPGLSVPTQRVAIAAPDSGPRYTPSEFNDSGSSASRRKASGSSKLLNKLFSGSNAR